MELARLQAEQAAKAAGTVEADAAERESALPVSPPAERDEDTA
jgi:hypothetical protein